MTGQGPAAHPAAVAMLVEADHLDELGVGSGRIQGLKNPDGSRRELDVVALVKVHGRAASKGIERIDARLAGHDQAGAGMGRCAGGGEGGEGVQAGQEVGPLADRLRWPGPRQLRGFPADSQTGHLPHRGCMRQGRRDAADTIWPVVGRDSRRLGLEEAWAGALRGLERRRRRIDLW